VYLKVLVGGKLRLQYRIFPNTEHQFYQHCSEFVCVRFKACRDKGVDCIVAPYEADAQLAYLNKCGIAQLVITEDSDLVLFGCDRVRVSSSSS